MTGFDRMQMEEHVRQDRHDAVTRGIRVTVAENGFPDLPFGNVLLDGLGGGSISELLFDHFLQFIQHVSSFNEV